MRNPTWTSGVPSLPSMAPLQGGEPLVVAARSKRPVQHPISVPILMDEIDTTVRREPVLRECPGMMPRHDEVVLKIRYTAMFCPYLDRCCPSTPHPCCMLACRTTRSNACCACACAVHVCVLCCHLLTVTQWVLEMSPDSGHWHPVWQWPLVAVVVVLAVALSALLFIVLIAWCVREDVHIPPVCLNARHLKAGMGGGTGKAVGWWSCSAESAKSVVVAHAALGPGLGPLSQAGVKARGREQWRPPLLLSCLCACV